MPEVTMAIPRKPNLTPKKIWAYAYQIVPSQPEERLASIKALLEHEHTDATHTARTWEGRFVHEEQITHILVVADSPDQNLEVNRRLSAELSALHAGFSVTVPMAVTEEPVPPI
jgi:hypothetical protein